jgi:hypothetical protein
MNNIITLLIALSVIILISCLIASPLNRNRNRNSISREEFATGDICTVSLTNINPMFVKNYMQYDGQQIKCFNKLSSKAYCVGGTLKMDVKTVGTDANGVPLAGKQTAVISNSNGSTLPNNASIPIEPWEFPNFFCLS